MRQSPVLPPGVTVFERGWLSANNVLFTGPDGAALVDSGYESHSAQTLALVQRALGDEPLARLLNTHLHSDHCGGNAALQSRYPAIRTLIPPGQAQAVRRWDRAALGYDQTGQRCPRFHFDGLLHPGDEVSLGGRAWQVHAARGHDPHSVILFEPQSRVLVSADALWQNGFGIVFPELEGEEGFDDVAETLDVIESLAPRVVIPGHGEVFTDVPGAMVAARGRLFSYRADPHRHAVHAAKVLLKFKLLDVQDVPVAELERWAGETPYFQLVFARYFGNVQLQQWLHSLIEGLVKSKAALVSGGRIVNI